MAVITRKQLEENRHQGFRIYGYKKSFCDLNDCCERCDRVISFWCRVIRWIEDIQIKRIKKICK